MLNRLTAVAAATALAVAALVACSSRDVARAEAAAPSQPAASPAAAPATRPAPRWFKGNLHTHSLWSDGDDFPERIAEWYREHGYQFLAISDHNTTQQGEKWVRLAKLKLRGGGPAAEDYLKRFADVAKTRGGDPAGDAFEIRLTPFAEYRPRLERPGSFLLIPSEEVSDTTDEGRPIHMIATNLHGPAVKPQSGKEDKAVAVIRKNLLAIEEQGRREGKPVLPHLAHPNFGWAVTAEEMAQVVEERFFEIHNGHPIVRQAGDDKHPSVERMWDIANTLRLTALNAAPLYGVGVDDAHNYHARGTTRATTGRGWVQVRAADLSAESLIAAMKAGDFYASSGVTLADVRYDAAAGTLAVEVAPDGDATFKTQFIGTLAPPPGGTVAAADVGVVLATVEGTRATYKLTGKELYVRAIVTSNKQPEDPSMKDQFKQAWTQPVGWEKRAGEKK